MTSSLAAGGQNMEVVQTGGRKCGVSVFLYVTQGLGVQSTIIPIYSLKLQPHPQMVSRHPTPTF